jgi:prevent-host-death family protein
LATGGLLPAAGGQALAHLLVLGCQVAAASHIGMAYQSAYNHMVILTISERQSIMSTIASTAEVKARLSEFVSRVLLRGDRVIVARRGRPVAALVGLDDLQRLEALDAERAAGTPPERHPVMAAFGAWSDGDDWDNLLADVYAERAAAQGRELPL